MTTTDYLKNILDVYARATDDEKAHGLDWYAYAQGIALDLSPADVWRGAGVLSALSPLKKWDLNVRIASVSFETGIAQGNMPMHNAIAQRILDGEFPLDVMKGDKTRSFAEAIATGGNGSIATIDRHAHDIAMAEFFTDKTRKIGKRVYREMAVAYSEAADTLGISVNAVQAITWVAWRREKGIV